jgi:hypothetical protein
MNSPPPKSEEFIIEKAIAQLDLKNTLLIGDRQFVIRSLLPHSSWRPMKVSWWFGKEACIIGFGDEGTVYFRVCDGTVRYWDNKKSQHEILSASVRQFLAGLKPAAT